MIKIVFKILIHENGKIFLFLVTNKQTIIIIDTKLIILDYLIQVGYQSM